MLRHAAFELDALLAYPLESGSVQRLLRIHAVVYHVDQHLQMSLRLHKSSHHAERPDGAPVFGEEPGYYSVIWALIAFKEVVAGGVQAEISGSVLHGYTRARDGHAGAENLIAALNERNHISV